MARTKVDHLKLKLETHKNGRIEKKGGKGNKGKWGPSGGPKGKVQIILGDSQQGVTIRIAMMVMGGANMSGGKNTKPNK